ncbi:MAG: hypothetical protein NZ561_04855, partial [Phycisphaerae bacterium]|nr:hypothetical protein [Phycisphaerae bacterium]
MLMGTSAAQAVVGLPPGARLVASGYRQIQFTPGETGRVYLVDARRDRLLFQHGIDAGDTFTVV